MFDYVIKTQKLSKNFYRSQVVFKIVKTDLLIASVAILRSKNTFKLSVVACHQVGTQLHLPHRLCLGSICSCSVSVRIQAPQSFSISDWEILTA